MDLAAHLRDGKWSRRARGHIRRAPRAMAALFTASLSPRWRVRSKVRRPPLRSGGAQYSDRRCLETRRRRSGFSASRAGRGEAAVRRASRPVAGAIYGGDGAWCGSPPLHLWRYGGFRCERASAAHLLSPQDLSSAAVPCAQPTPTPVTQVTRGLHKSRGQHGDPPAPLPGPPRRDDHGRRLPANQGRRRRARAQLPSRYLPT